MITFKQFLLKEDFEYTIDPNTGGGETPHKQDVESKKIIRFKRNGKIVGIIYGNLDDEKFQIEFADVKDSDEENDKGGFFRTLLRQLTRKFTVISDEDNVTAFQELGGAQTKNGRYVLRKK